MPKGYGQFCPVAKAAEVFAERWTPLVLRELCRGCSQFNEIHAGVPLMSRTLLAQRLKELAWAGVVDAVPKPSGRGHSYRLSTAGLAFCPIIDQLSDWGTLWARQRIGPEDCDPGFLLWALRGHADPRFLPDERFVIAFEFRDMPRGARFRTRWWLVAEDHELDACWEDPGFPVDVDVRASLPAMVAVWLGFEGLGTAERRGVVELHGERQAIALTKRLLDLRDRPIAKRFHVAPAMPATAAALS